MNLDLNLTTYTKIDSKQVIDCIVLQLYTVYRRLLKENIGVNLRDPGLGEEFLGMTPEAQSIKENQ